MKACGNPKCGTSTGIDGSLTFGSGELDEWGYWSKPCRPCAENFEARNPELAQEYGPVWPPAQPQKDVGR